MSSHKSLRDRESRQFGVQPTNLILVGSPTRRHALMEISQTVGINLPLHTARRTEASADIA